ncbi:hypothetical protein GQ54DRAFT_150016 [Martensiomyces pterosporus]|nr:hypothetical protein GQ54DRAFT_150016 [Martensiomyces pterosporus]
MAAKHTPQEALLLTCSLVLQHCSKQAARRRRLGIMLVPHDGDAPLLVPLFRRFTAKEGSDCEHRRMRGGIRKRRLKRGLVPPAIDWPDST